MSAQFNPKKGDFMTTASLTQAGKQTPRRGWHIPERTQSFLLLLPSILALIIFVYVFISLTFWVSLSNWRM